MASASGPASDNIYLEPPREGIKLYTTILTDGKQEDGTFPAVTTYPKTYPNNAAVVEILPIKRIDNKLPGFSLVKMTDGVAGYIRTQYLAKAGAALRAAGRASGAAAAAAAAAVPVAVSPLPPVAVAADRSKFSVADLDKLNNPPFLIEGDQTSAIIVMVHTTSQTGAQILDKEGTPNPSGLYYPNGSELRLVEDSLSDTETETGEPGTATSTRLVQIDDDKNGNGWLPMGCLLRTTLRNEFDIDGFWRTALAEADQNVVNSAGEILGTVQQARIAHGDGSGFDFGRYGKDYELFRNEYMPHILRPKVPIVPWVRRERREGREGREGGTRRRKCKKGKKSRSSRSSRSSRASRHRRHSRHSRHHRRR
jgi:hypothetical protein